MENPVEQLPLFGATAKPGELYPGFDDEFERLLSLYENGTDNSDNDEYGSVSRRVLKELVTSGFKAKEKYRDILGLGPDLRVRFEVDDYGFAEHDLFNYLKYVLNDENYVRRFGSEEKDRDPVLPTTDEDGRDIIGMFKDGKVKRNGRTLRLTRYLVSAVRDSVWGAFRRRNYWDMHRYLVKREISGDSERRAVYDTRTFSDFVSKVMEQVSAGRAQAMLSYNPLDILLASEEAGFRSCHRFAGEYGNGPTIYARDSFSGIVMTLDPEFPEYPFMKTSRAMVFIPSPYTRYAIGRTYGKLFDPQVKTISEFIGKAISTSRELEPSWVGKSKHQYDGHISVLGDSPKAMYFDYSVARYTYHKSLRESGDHHPSPDLSFPGATCLECGKIHNDHEERLQCGECAGLTACSDCGGAHREDDLYWVNDEQVCSSCRDNNCTYCYICDEHKPEDEVEYIRTARGWRRHVCDSCRDGYVECVHCDRQDDPDEMPTVADGDHVCPGCADAKYTRCDGCDELHPDEDCERIQGCDYCEGCKEDTFTDCAECARTTYNDDTREVDGAVYCDDCASAKEDDSAESA